MKSSIKNKFIKLGFLEDNSFTVYGQEIIDKFLSIIITKLKSEGFKHYNLDFINNKKEGKYYRINNYTLEIMSNLGNINHEALNLQYMLSRILKDYLGVSLIEGYKYRNNSIYYYGYILLKDLENMYTIKQNKSKTYLRFDLRNILYSIYDDNSYLSYHLAPYIKIIPLHQNKSGVLSYANKIKDNLKISSKVDERNISPIDKKKEALNERVPLIIYVGPKEYKHNKALIELNNERYELSFEELNNIDQYLIKSLKDKINNNLKFTYSLDKEVTNINLLTRISKVNICNNCLKNYKYIMHPFNRINKSVCCLVCNEKINNVVYIKK